MLHPQDGGDILLRNQITDSNIAYSAGPSGRAFYGASGIAGSNPTGGMDVCFECYVLSGRGLCDEPITRPEESYRM